MVASRRGVIRGDCGCSSSCCWLQSLSPTLRIHMIVSILRAEALQLLLMLEDSSTPLELDVRQEGFTVADLRMVCLRDCYNACSEHIRQHLRHGDLLYSCVLGLGAMQCRTGVAGLAMLATLVRTSQLCLEPVLIIDAANLLAEARTCAC
jgi:hypothetical protein